MLSSLWLATIQFSSLLPIATKIMLLLLRYIDKGKFPPSFFPKVENEKSETDLTDDSSQPKRKSPIRAFENYGLTSSSRVIFWNENRKKNLLFSYGFLCSCSAFQTAALLVVLCLSLFPPLNPVFNRSASITALISYCKETKHFFLLFSFLFGVEDVN